MQFSDSYKKSFSFWLLDAINICGPVTIQQLIDLFITVIQEFPEYKELTTDQRTNLKNRINRQCKYLADVGKIEIERHETKNKTTILIFKPKLL